MLSVMLLYGSLDNYILAYRKEAGLSQDELAILLGLEGRASVARYEQVRRLPELQMLIGLELIFDEPVQKMFAGMAERVRGDLPARARALLEGMGEKPTAQNIQKLATLARLAHLDDIDQQLTRQLIGAGALMGIDLLDHIIVGHDGRYFSFKEIGEVT